MPHWYTAVSTLAIAVLLASHVLLQRRLDSCLHEATPESPPRNLVKEPGSSVWCSGVDHTTRLCRFKNLCYLPQHHSFAFFHNDNASVISGVPTDRFSPTLLDLSTVANHSGQYFNYADVPSWAAHRLLGADTRVVDGQSLIFNRFHPGNLMHVLHDDLLPLYDTLKMITRRGGADMTPFDVQLVMMDSHEPGPFQHLYNMFLTRDPIYKSQLHGTGAAVCFVDAYVGLSKETRWYDYGFDKPQRPSKDHTATARHIRPAAEFFRARLGVCLSESVPKEAVILSRRHNRLIVNEAELSFELAANIGVRVRTLSMEDVPIEEIIKRLSSAAVVVGMHGSLLALAMFLPPGSILVELFPYAINPLHYTPYRTLASLPGMDITYRAWRNMDPNRSITHPSELPEIGGIAHLASDEQDRILHSSEVPLHLCCNDPEWLFRIYQDTIVDVAAVIGLIRNGLDKPLISSPNPPIHHRPTEVRQLVCIQNNDPGLSLSWEPPWNVEYLSVFDLQYEVWIQEKGSDAYTAWILFEMSHQFVDRLRSNTWYLIWVRCLLSDDVKGPFNVAPLRCRTKQLAD